jgi:hypothetical protein
MDRHPPGSHWRRQPGASGRDADDHAGRGTGCNRPAGRGDGVRAGHTRPGRKQFRGETKRLRTELVTHQMRPIATIAQMAIPDVVRITEALRMPAKKIRAEGLIAAAESMAVLGEKYQDQLATGGLAANFVAQLRSVAAAYKQAIDTRGQAVVSRKGATEGLNAQLATGRKVVETLSVIVRQRLRQDPVALAEWHQAKRVTIKGAQSRSPVAAPTVGAPSAASTPVAAAAAPVGPTASAVVTSAPEQHQTA